MSTTVWVAAIAGAAGVLGGSIPAIVQSRADQRRLAAEAAREERRIAEDHLRHRQGVYHQLLATLQEGIRVGGTPTTEWLQRFDEQSQGVILFGSVEIAQATRDAAAALDADGDAWDNLRELQELMREDVWRLQGKPNGE